MPDRESPKAVDDSTERIADRRGVLRAAGAAAAVSVAGCLGLGDEEPAEEPDTGRDPDWCVDENDVPVPEEYRTAESIDGIERDPDELSGREEAAYQCHPQGYQLCGNCTYFIPGHRTDEQVPGACAIVEGIARSQDWCALFEPMEALEDFPSPAPFEEDGPTKPPGVGSTGTSGESS
ncbi:HiPIP domain protein [Natronomonas pharaonis DSM 2160]|uniref:HiPIP domain protein n=1 Tax=Natronomonas pharaonis (strain ATCC 35678 / DSM 2160 / CIP 103997 / JCM 8858 / NBRC 14720 / NCIMB 2260 / Gabara) TaxID=348780 RepID=A0A1U7EVK3_NATPD|nr:hypothetical protein [Natronomonas pharaonis]CAI49035.1 HiPIP domain protein [Natronomonas pharaonis DSM 2160]